MDRLRANVAGVREGAELVAEDVSEQEHVKSLTGLQHVGKDASHACQTLRYPAQYHSHLRRATLRPRMLQRDGNPLSSSKRTFEKVLRVLQV